MLRAFFLEWHKVREPSPTLLPSRLKRTHVKPFLKLFFEPPASLQHLGANVKARIPELDSMLKEIRDLSSGAVSLDSLVAFVETGLPAHELRSNPMFDA